MKELGLLVLVAVGCHKEGREAPPPEDSGCFGATCVEQAEAAMYYGDHASAREPLAAVCENKDGFACFRLAELYQHGKGGPADLTKAGELYEQACTFEYGEGCERRAELAKEGLGGPQVELDFSLKACEAQRGAACTRAGEQLNTARGVERDATRAIEMYEKACGLGEVAGCVGAGDLLFDPRGKQETKVRALAAFNSACVGHDGYGCLKLGIAVHEGLGTPRDVARAKTHFARACEFNVQDGCHVAKQLEQSGGEPVVLELTTAADQLSGDGLEARSVSCRMSEQGLPALGAVMSGVARHKRSLDNCAKDGAAVSVRWEFAQGRVQEAKIRGYIQKKTAKCIEATIRRARMPAIGTCQAVFLLGDPDGAAKSLAARIARQKTKPKRDTAVHVRMGEDDDE